MDGKRSRWTQEYVSADPTKLRIPAILVTAGADTVSPERDAAVLADYGTRRIQATTIGTPSKEHSSYNRLRMSITSSSRAVTRTPNAAISA